MKKPTEIPTQPQKMLQYACALLYLASLCKGNERDLLKYLNVKNNIPRFALPVISARHNVNVSFGFEVVQVSEIINSVVACLG